MGSKRQTWMNSRQDSMILPGNQVVDYEALLDDRPGESPGHVVSDLIDHLPYMWRDLYVAAVSRPTNIVQVRSRTFKYIFDFYSELEATGEIPYDQTVEDRLVGGFGISEQPREARGTRFRGWLLDTGELGSATRDKGHFIAHCIGGDFDLNVFSQDRELNRGWSP